MYSSESDVKLSHPSVHPSIHPLTGVRHFRGMSKHFQPSIWLVFPLQRNLPLPPGYSYCISLDLATNVISSDCDISRAKPAPDPLPKRPSIRLVLVHWQKRSHPLAPKALAGQQPLAVLCILRRRTTCFKLHA